MDQAPPTRDLLLTRHKRTEIDLDLTSEGKIVYNTDSVTGRTQLLFVSGDSGFSLSLDNQSLAQLADAIGDAAEAVTENRATTGAYAWAVLSLAETVTLQLRDPISQRGDELVMNCVCHTCPGGLCQLTATAHPHDGIMRLALHNDTQLYAVALTPPQQHALATHLQHHADDATAANQANSSDPSPVPV